MKKVLMIASVASMIDQFNMQNIKILQEQGYEVHVAANFGKGNPSSPEKIEKFKCKLKEKGISYFQIDFSRNVTNIMGNIKAYKQIKKIMKKNKYEFIHCHSPIGGVCGRIASKMTNTKCIYTAHGFHFYKGAPKINWMIYYPIEKLCSYFTDVLITINNEDYELAKHKMKAKKVCYVPGVGVDIDKIDKVVVNKEEKRRNLGIGMDDIVVLSVGELSKRKNHEVIIKALGQISNENIHYVIAGRGDLENYLIDLAKSLGIEKRVHLLGFRNDISELCKASDIFCFSSKQEGLPVALMEAMACGLPVVCSDIRGNKDLIKGNLNGYLFNYNNVEELTKIIYKLTSNKMEMYDMGKCSKKDIKRFAIKNVNEDMSRLYIELT